MVPADDFMKYHKELLDGSYDCVDRIVLRAYCSPLQTGGGFRLWWRQLFGSDESLDKNHLLRMAGRFSRRVGAWCRKKKVPLIYCKPGARKHEIAESHLPQDKSFIGIFLVTVSKMSTATYVVRRSNGGSLHLEKRYAFVNHYAFHIMDAQWGHIAILVSGHPPFNALVMLNGHEWVERIARKRKLRFTKSGNCFVELPNTQTLNRIAETLNTKHSVGRLRSVCVRWIYTCLSFGLGLEEQRRSRFCYSFAIYQGEYSRNLLFRQGRDMQRVFEGMIDRTRGTLDLRKVVTWFGFKQRPQRRKWKQQKRRPRFGVTVETLEYNLTVFKVHLGNLTLKAYSKGERVLRIEAIAHNAKGLRCGNGLDRFDRIVSVLQTAVVRFLDTLHCADIAFLDSQTIEDLGKPTSKGSRRLAGVDLQKPRTRAAIEALLPLSSDPKGFTSSELASRVSARTGQRQYGIRQASYDLRKLAGKRLVEKTKRSRRYHVVLPNLQRALALIIVSEKVIKPLAASAGEATGFEVNQWHRYDPPA